MEQGFDARFLSTDARKVCRALSFTPRRWEPLNTEGQVDCESPELPVLRVWNSRREIIITNHDLAYAREYL